MSRLFWSTFRVGDFSEWDSSVTDGGNLSVATAARLNNSNYGLSVNCAGNSNDKYVQNSLSWSSGRFLSIRFWLDPNGISASNKTTKCIHLSDSGTHRFALRLRVGASSWELKMAWDDDSGTQSGDNYNITDAPHYVEYQITRASSAVASDGKVELFVDGTSQGSETNLDIYDVTYPDTMTMGGDGFGGSINGTFYMDELDIYDEIVTLGKGRGRRII